MDRAHEKARETRRRNAELRKAGMEMQKQDEALVVEALRSVLRDPEASTEQRIFAVSVLDNMKRYNFVPYDIKNGTKSDDLIADFAKQLKASQNA